MDNAKDKRVNLIEQITQDSEMFHKLFNDMDAEGCFDAQLYQVGDNMDNRKGFRNFQLACMGWLSIAIAPVVLIVTTLIYSLPFPQSISETGTMANMVSPILPFALGALALFSLSYAIRYAYDYFWDKLFTLCMCAGFTLVAMFPCASPYVTSDRVGLLGVSLVVSNWIHCVGALIGFGAMICWILFCFTKSDKAKADQSKQKRVRNLIYNAMGYSIAICLAIFLLSVAGQLTAGFALTYWLEAVILCGSGVCCLFKSGALLKDR